MNKPRKILADTNLFIALLEQVPSVEEVYDLDWHFSIISRIELLSKPAITPAEETEIISMLEKATFVPFNDDVELLTITLRRKHRCKLPDAIIAATAMFHKLTLVTFDRGFAGIDGLDVIVLDYA